MRLKALTFSWPHGLAAAVGVLTAWLFAANFSVATNPHLNADQVIHALMAERFDWSRDAYYWGQDRLGSLLPFLGSVLTTLGLDGLNAMVWVQAAVLLGCGALWAWLVRDVLLAVLGWAALTLPPYPFYELVNIGHPYLSQFGVGLGLLALLEAERRGAPARNDRGDNHGSRKGLREGIRAAVIPLTAWASIWASELSVALLAPAMWCYRDHLGVRLRQHPWVFAVATLIGAVALWAAKAGAPHQRGFARLLAEPHDILGSMANQWSEWIMTLNGTGNKPFNLIFWWVVLAMIAILVAWGLIRRTPASALTRTLALATLASWAAVHASGWNAANDFPLRYFAAAYGWGALAVLSYLRDSGRITRPSLAVVLIGLWGLQAWAAWSFTTQFSTGARGRLSRAQAVELLREAQNNSGSVAFIGSYWNSYLLDGLSGTARGVPHEGDYCRDRRHLTEVLYHGEVIAVAAGWLEVLPDTLRQYSTTWVKRGPTVKSDGTDYARYARVEGLTQDH